MNIPVSLPDLDHPRLVKIYLLGRFEVIVGDQRLTADAWPRKKAASLMKRLVFERRLLKDQVMEFLWPEADLASAANNLYKTLHVIRRTLDSAFGSGSADVVFRFEDSILSLLPDVWVDAAEFERLAKSASDADELKIKQALELYQGDLLPDDLYEEWTQLPRDELFRLLRGAVLRLAFLHHEDQSYGDAIALLRPLLARDPVDEPVHCELMRLYALSGQQPEALRQYQTCVHALKQELGTSPDEETTALYQQIRSGTLFLFDTPPVSSTGFPLPAVKKQRSLFVARERELDILQAHLADALSGKGQVIFITGEAGQGKTSLMAEFSYQAQLWYPDLVAACGTCQMLAGIADPYLPFRDIMAMLTGDWQRPWVGGDIPVFAASRLQALAPITTRLIADHAPDLIGVLAPVNLRSDNRTRSQTSLNQRQVFDQLGGLLRILSRQQPVLLLVDDLQWADAASVNLLFYLARQLVNSRILIVGAYRPSEVNQVGITHPLAPAVRELVGERGNIRIDLDASQPGEERAFLDALLDSEPNRLDASFREAFYRRTRGHPLFSVELLRALQDQGELVQDESGMWTARPEIGWNVLPTRVEAVIAQRIDHLPADLRRLLEIASIEGESFTVEVVSHVQNVPVLTLLNDLSLELDQRYRLVREQGEMRIGNQTLTRYQFRHHLFQQYLYHQLSQAQRRYLHGKVAEVLEKFTEIEPGPLIIPLAYHFLAAGDLARAVTNLIQAGDDARSRVALEEAVHFYESALESWQANDPVPRAQVLQKVGEMLLALGKSSEAIQRFSEADQLYTHAGSRSGMGAVQRLIGRSYFEQGDREKAIDHYHRVLTLLEHDPENAELVRASSAIAQMHMSANQYDEAIDWGERALSLARAADIEDVTIHALVTVGTSLANKGESERGLAMLVESQERAEALGQPHDAGRAFAGWGDALVTLERYEEAREIYNRMLAYAQKVHTSMFEGVALVQLGYLDWWEGHWRQAWARRQEIIDWMATFPGASFAKVWASNFLGLIYNDLGMPEKAGAVLVDYSAVARSANEPQTTTPHLGQLARCAKSQAQKAKLVQEIMALTDTAAYPPYEIMPALRLACEWLTQSSRGDVTALDRLEKVHAQMQNHQSTAALHDVRAIAAGIQGEWGQAVSHYKVAAANWEALERPYDLLRTLAGLIKALAFTWQKSTQTADRKVLQDIRKKANLIIEQLANELDEPEVKHAFLTSPLVMVVHSSQSA